LRRRPDGLKFRRQHPIGPYIADFYCPAAKLIVEIDGQSHSTNERSRHDARRAVWLKEQGLEVIRFSAIDVTKTIDAVITAIIAACRK
jgi:very-short-patch-repair endonuclease